MHRDSDASNIKIVAGLHAISNAFLPGSFKRAKQFVTTMNSVLGYRADRSELPGNSCQSENLGSFMASFHTNALDQGARPFVSGIRHACAIVLMCMSMLLLVVPNAAAFDPLSDTSVCTNLVAPPTFPAFSSGLIWSPGAL
jgi:hypothetical protein